MAQIELYVNTFFSVRSFVRLSFGPFNDRLQTGWEVSWSVRTVICVPFCLCVFVSFSFSLVRSLHATISHFDWSGFYWTCSGQLASVWYIRNVCEEAIISAFIKFESIIYTFFQYKILMFGSLANNVGTSKSPVWFAVFVVALLRNSFPFCCCFFFPVLCVCVFAVRSLFEYSFFSAFSSFSLFVFSEECALFCFFWFVLSVHRDVVCVVVAGFYCCVPFWCPFCRSVQAKAWRHIPFHLRVYAHIFAFLFFAFDFGVCRPSCL